MAEKPKPEQDEKGRFVSGNIGGGRPKGARSKLSEAFIEALFDDFEQHGAAVIATVREEKPDQYLRVVASLVPKDLNLHVNEFEGMSDEDLDKRLRALTDQFLPALIGDEDGGEATDPVH